jgi:tetratricopeptide (TPR) repeat protein
MGASVTRYREMLSERARGTSPESHPLSAASTVNDARLVGTSLLIRLCRAASASRVAPSTAAWTLSNHAASWRVSELVRTTCSRRYEQAVTDSGVRGWLKPPRHCPATDDVVVLPRLLSAIDRAGREDTPGFEVRRFRTRKFNRSLCCPNAWCGRLNPTVWARPDEGGGLSMTSSRLACVLVLLLPSLAVAGDFERGQEALNKGDYDLAITCFAACIRENPKNVAAYVNRGIAYYGTVDFDKAIADYTEAIRLDPKFATAYVYRGLVYWQKQDYDKAIADYSDAIRLDPKDANTYFNRGIAYSSTKDYDKAVADYTEAIRLDPKFANAYNNRGAAYLDKKAYDKAIADYSDAIHLDAKFARAYYGRGVAYHDKKDYEKAIADYEAAIRFDPKSPPYNKLAWLLATCPKDELRDGRKAIEYARKAGELSNWKNPLYLGTLAAAFAESSDFKEAVKWERKAIDLGYDDEKETEKARQRLKLYEEGKPYRDE